MNLSFNWNNFRLLWKSEAVQAMRNMRKLRKLAWTWNQNFRYRTYSPDMETGQKLLLSVNTGICQRQVTTDLKPSWIRVTFGIFWDEMTWTVGALFIEIPGWTIDIGLA